MAFTIAVGGFALVFILLILLSCTVWVTKIVVEKITKSDSL